MKDKPMTVDEALDAYTTCHADTPSQPLIDYMYAIEQELNDLKRSIGHASEIEYGAPKPLSYFPKPSVPEFAEPYPKHIYEARLIINGITE